jgi:PAS domain S-box-containing protein
MQQERSSMAGDTDLFESERRFRLLVEGVTDYSIFMLDPEGFVTNWNAGAQRIKGYEAAEIVGEHFSTFYTPEDRAAGLPMQSLKTAADEGKFEDEGWRLRKDGSRFLASVVIAPLHERDRLVGFAKVTRDITERHKAQQALLDSERRFRVLVSSVTDYALYMLDTEGRVTSWNAGGEHIKGYTAEEIVGQHFSRFYTPEGLAANKPARALEIARTTGRYEEDGWRVRKDGTYFWASVVIDAIRDDDGKIIGFAKITRDITERRQAQLALEKMQRQLAEAQKLDALGQLTGGVAHDFNNLLMIVSGHLQCIRRAVDGEPRVQRAIQAIELASQRGASLTKQLLSFSRRQRVNPTPIHVAERIGAVREVLNSGLGSGVGMLVDVPADTWPISVDIGEFEIALVNLAVNARDAMPAGGLATVSARNVRLDEPPLQGDFVAITVEDVGVGIPADVMDKIFDPFFTTKPVGKGTGLGLSQVHGFVHQAGGTLKVRSTLGQGTAITMYFPRAQDHAQGAGAAAAFGGRAFKGGTVLLVEDNPEVADASAELLTQLGYEVRWAPDAVTALKEVEHDGIDLVFSDIVMPGPMDGLQLARAIRQKRPDLPILLATGYSEKANAAASDLPILRKPYQMHELSRALASLTRNAA